MAHVAFSFQVTNIALNKYHCRSGPLVVVGRCDFLITSSLTESEVKKAFDVGTHNHHTLGPYLLKNDSADTQVTVYEPQPPTPQPPTLQPTTAQPMEKQSFYLEFTVLNRTFSEDLDNASSTLYQNYNSDMSSKLEDLFKKQLGDSAQNCSVTNFWSGPLVVVARCSFDNTSQVNESVVEEAFKRGTNELQNLDYYELDKTSLTVSIPEPQPPTMVPSTTPAAVNIIQTLFIKFTVVNHTFSPDLDNKSSALYKEYTSSISKELEDLFKKELGNETQNCTVARYWSGPLVVVGRCDFLITSSLTESEVKKAFDVGTHNHHTLGPYLLKNDSADTQVTVYEPQPPTPQPPTLQPTTAQPMEKQSFYLEFTVLNRTFSEDLDNASSTLYQNYNSDMSSKLEDLFKKQLGDSAQNCSVTNFWSGPLVVVARCSFDNTSQVNESVVEEAFKRGTNELQNLDYYELDKTSLTISIPEPQPPTMVPSTTPAAVNIIQTLFIKFTVVNHTFSPDLDNKSSPLYKEYTSSLSKELEDLFKKELGNETQNCTVARYWSGPLVVVGRCDFLITSSLTESEVKKAFDVGTHNHHTLGPYLLKNDSADTRVTVYEPQPPTPQPPTLQPTTAQPMEKQSFYLEFTVLNRTFSEDLDNASSTLYQNYNSDISSKLEDLFKKQLGDSAQNCSVTNFWSGPLVVVARCSFDNTSQVNESVVEEAFKRGTNELQNLDYYELDKTSLTVSSQKHLNNINEEKNVHLVPEPQPPTMVPSTTPAAVNIIQTLFIKFTVVNHTFSPDLDNKSSPLYKEYTSSISKELEDLFKKELGNETQNCTVARYWSGPLVVVGRCDFLITSSLTESEVKKAFDVGTHNHHTLGPYLLKNDSADTRVTVYEPQPPTPQPPTLQPTTAQPMEKQSFYLEFTVLNRTFSEDLDNASSTLYQNYNSDISSKLEDLFKKQLGDSAQNCSVTNFWSGPLVVVARCSFDNTSQVNESVVEEAFKRGTNELQNLDYYELDKTSLTVSIPEPQPPTMVPSTTPAAVNIIQTLFIKFTVVNHTFSPDLDNKSSPLYKEYTSSISKELEDLFKKELGNETQNCTVARYWSGPLVVVGRCDFLITSSLTESEVKKAFDVGTHNHHTLGPYLLKNDSADTQVTVYEPQPPTPQPPTLQPTTAQPMEKQSFYLEFTVLNRTFSEDLDNASSTLYQNYNSDISSKLEDLFKKQLGDSAQNCSVTNFWSGPLVVVARCSFDNTSQVNESVVEEAFKRGTNELQNLDYYELDKTSLTVSIPEPQPPTMVPSTTPAAVNIIQTLFIKFTVVNHTFSPDLDNKSSPLYKEYTSSISKELEDLFKKELGNETQNCTVARYWSGPLVVVGRCDFLITSSLTESEVKKAFDVGTHNHDTLGPYLLKNDSADTQVTVYEPQPPTPQPPTLQPTTAQPMEKQSFYLEFTVLNRTFSEDLDNASSTLYQNYNSDISSKLEDLFKKQLGDSAQNCSVTNFWSGPLVVVARCSFDNTSQVNESVVEEAFKRGTNELQNLDYYELDKTSLTVSIPEPQPPTMVPSTTPTAVQTIRTLFIKFTVVNHTFSPDLDNTSSPLYKEYTSSISKELEDLFKKELGSETQNCTVARYWSGPLVVVGRCDFLNTSSLSETKVKKAFDVGTNDHHTLGPYLLKSDPTDTQVTAYEPQPPTTVQPPPPPTTTTTTTTLSPDKLDKYEIKFTIINRNFTDDLNNPNSAYYKKLVKNIEARLNNLYRGTYPKLFKYCKVTGLRIGSVKTDCHCYFEKDSAVEADLVTTFSNKTNSTSWLNEFQLEPTSLSVKEIVKREKPLPFWVIFVIGLCCLIFAALLALLAVVCAMKYFRHRTASFKTQKSDYGTYFPHLDMRKVY
uniref:mucin-16-like n=1 Tax=Myxine glutinosa TaxID=7769 RepID=UPI0035901235